MLCYFNKEKILLFLFINQEIFLLLHPQYMEDVAQLVRASDCGSESRGFEPHLPPQSPAIAGLFCFYNLSLSIASSLCKRVG
jgi:hypothetical protein